MSYKTQAVYHVDGELLEKFNNLIQRGGRSKVIEDCIRTVVEQKELENEKQ